LFFFFPKNYFYYFIILLFYYVWKISIQFPFNSNQQSTNQTHKKTYIKNKKTNFRFIQPLSISSKAPLGGETLALNELRTQRAQLLDVRNALLSYRGILMQEETYLNVKQITNININTNIQSHK